MSTVLDNKWIESYWMNDLRKVKTQASSLVPLGAGPVAPLCFHTCCPDYVESCGIVTGRLEYPLLHVNFSAQKRRKQRRREKPLSASGFIGRSVGKYVRKISDSNQKRCCFKAHVMMMMKKSDWWRHAGLHQQSWNEAASKRSLWRSVENVTFLLLLLISRQTEHNSSSRVHIQTVVSSMRSHCCTRPDTSLCSVHTCSVSFVLWH